MKIKLLSFSNLMVALLLSASISFAQDWSWVSVHSGPQGNEGSAIAVDADGNSYTIGSYYGSITFGDTVLTSAGSYDIFIAKHSADGELLWAVSAGGSNQDLGTGITVDPNGDIIVTGTFRQMAYFGDLSLTSGGAIATFIVKYNPSGEVIWARAGTTVNSVLGRGVATDAMGNVYATGYFLYSCQFDGVTLSTTGYRDFYVVKYNPEGVLQWAAKSDGSNFIHSNAIATDPLGNSVITGYFSGNMIINTDTLVAPGNYGIFIVHIDADGNLMWGRQSGGTTTLFDEGYGVTMDANGNAYVTGVFHGMSQFGDYLLEGNGISSTIFLATYDQNGNVLWANQAGSPGDDRGSAVSLDAIGNVYLTGSVNGIASFNGTTLPSLGNQDIFVAKYSTEGVFQWVQQAGGAGVDRALGIASDADGHCYITGSFRGTAIFGVYQVEAIGSLSDVFIAKTGIPVSIEVAQTNEFITLLLYPNPSNGIFNISQNEPNALIRLNLYNAAGSLLLSKTIEGSGSIDAGKLPAGIYFLHAESAEWKAIQKLIIQ